MNTNAINRQAVIAEERELCKVVLGWTIVGLILGLLVWNVLTAIGGELSLAGTEFTIAGIFFTVSLIIEPILLARRVDR